MLTHHIFLEFSPPLISPSFSIWMLKCTIGIKNYEHCSATPKGYLNLIKRIDRLNGTWWDPLPILTRIKEKNIKDSPSFSVHLNCQHIWRKTVYLARSVLFYGFQVYIRSIKRFIFRDVIILMCIYFLILMCFKICKILMLEYELAIYTILSDG